MNRANILVKNFQKNVLGVFVRYKSTFFTFYYTAVYKNMLFLQILSATKKLFKIFLKKLLQLQKNKVSASLRFFWTYFSSNRLEVARYYLRNLTKNSFQNIP